MEEFQQYREQAKKNIRAADHILSVTYPLVKDTKLLLGVTENLLLALNNTIASIVSYERLFKRIPPYLENFDSTYNAFRLRIVPRYNIDKSYLEFVEKVREVVGKHKKSPIEFARKDKFVICSEGYKMETLSIKQLESYISKAREFFNEVLRITSKHETIFSR